MNRIRSIVRAWLPLAVAITLLCGLIYVAIQQTYRSNADDPQISWRRMQPAPWHPGSRPRACCPNSVWTLPKVWRLT